MEAAGGVPGWPSGAGSRLPCEGAPHRGWGLTCPGKERCSYSAKGGPAPGADEDGGDQG